MPRPPPGGMFNRHANGVRARRGQAFYAGASRDIDAVESSPPPDEYCGMKPLRFSLRQLLIAVAVTAVVLLVIRLALRAHDVAVALVVLGIAAVVLIALNVLVYALLRGVGALGAEREA
jgi:hypothetical protein